MRMSTKSSIRALFAHVFNGGELSTSRFGDCLIARNFGAGFAH